MVLIITRLLFILVLAAVALGTAEALGVAQLYALGVAMTVSLITIALDIAARRKSIASISAIFFGLLAGLITSLLLGQVINITAWVEPEFKQPLTLIGTVILCYVFISVIMQTKNDYRFIIPYVEFVPDKKSSRPLLLDTSAIIDGRIADLCETGIFDSQILIPRFILQELQAIADSPDRLRRNRGRRGLDMLNRLQGNSRVSIRIYDKPSHLLEHEAAPDAAEDVDALLVNLASELDGRIITVDYNLNKVAQFRGVAVININDMASSLKPVVLPGETMTVAIVKPGEAAGQGVGYLEDGTMVVVENARELTGQEVSLSVTSVLQTSAGRMIFGRYDRNGRPPKPRNGRSDENPSPTAPGLAEDAGSADGSKAARKVDGRNSGGPSA